jgi:NADPH:quinone reductase-like Zn-dependent oxidoreductase
VTSGVSGVTFGVAGAFAAAVLAGAFAAAVLAGAFAAAFLAGAPPFLAGAFTAAFLAGAPPFLVITTAGSDVKVQHGLQLGAVVGINYRNQDFVAATIEDTDHRGVDAILDVVGSDYLTRNVECLAPDGHLVIIGGSMAPTTLDLGLLMSKRASVTATMLRSRPPEQKAAIVAGVTRDVLPLFDTGAIRVGVDTVVPLRDAARAHELLESKQTVGKPILDNREVNGRPAR